MNKLLRICSVVILSLLLFACGGGGNGDNNSQDSSSPQIQSIDVDKSNIVVNKSENNSYELLVSVSYDDSSSDSLNLTLVWDSASESFSIASEDETGFQLSVEDDAENSAIKTVRLTDSSSNKSVALQVSIEDAISLVEAIALSTDKAALYVGESTELSLNIAYSSGESVQLLPEGFTCVLQAGEGVVSLSDNCEVTAQSVGTAEISLGIPEELLAAEIDVPVVEINVLETPVIDAGISRISLSISKDKVFVGDTLVIQPSATYDNGQIDQDISSLVKCIKLEGDAQTTLDGCVLNVLSAGDVVIGAELLDSSGNAPDVNPVVITVVEPALTGLSLGISELTVQQNVSSQHNIQLTRQFENGSTSNEIIQLQWLAESQSFSTAADFATTFSDGLLAIKENSFALTASLQIIISEAPPPKITDLKLVTENVALWVGESATISVFADYDNGQKDIDMSAMVNCSVAEASAQVELQNCRLKGLSAGTASVSVTLINPQEPSPVVTPLSISFADPQLTSISLDKSSLVVKANENSSHSVILSKEFEDGSIQDIGLNLLWDSVNSSFSGSEYALNFNASESVLNVLIPGSDLKASIDVVIEYPPGSLIEKLYFDSTSLEAVSGQTYPLVVMAQFSGELPNVYSNVSCTTNSQGLLGISNDCTELYALFPGNYEVTLALKDSSLAAAGMEIIPLEVSVSAVNLGSLESDSSFVINQAVGTSAIAFEIDGAVANEIYKLKLSAASPLPSITFHALSSWGFGQGCSNGSVFGEANVACGLEAMGNKVYVFLETLDKSIIGTTDFQLEILPDDNVLMFDGDYLLGKYEPLTVNTTYAGGHVGANNNGVNNLSLYKADVLNGSNVNGGYYEISIMFKSSYYQYDSVVVLHDSIDFNQAIFDYDVVCNDSPVTNTISCQVPNTEEPRQIVVEIYGNGYSGSPFQNSLTAVDGEVEYDILVTWNPPTP